ncbi:MAG: formylglycine-generating enzyme family protein [Treponema sp.]|nr:formylglycine-generating enzyme family protein [Treponema sp.]
MEHCGKTPPASCLVFYAFIAAVFITCGGAPPPAEQQPQQPPQPQLPLIEMVSIPGGSFRMGSTRETGLLNETPAHQVTLSDFLLGQYEITQGQYFEITGLRPSSCKTNPESRAIDGWKTLPVEMVNWYEALVFCNKLSIKDKLDPVYRVNDSTNPDDWGDIPTAEASIQWDVEWISGAKGYRLPTEAEWEYTARGGVNTTNRYSGSNTAEDVAWYYDNSGTMSHTVGVKQPNELNLYDMSGNVMEWCWDWQGAYTAGAQENPRGVIPGTTTIYRIIRGGGWSYAVNYCNVAYRHYNYPYYRGVNLGFRVVRSQ